jgi:hypothetical protein
MKTELFDRYLQRAQVLTEEACEAVRGGESTIWYWLSYLAGAFNGNQSGGQQSCNMALG